MADIETAIKDLEEIKDKLIPTISRMYGSGFSSVFACEKAEEKINNALELLREQQEAREHLSKGIARLNKLLDKKNAEIARLKEQQPRLLTLWEVSNAKYPKDVFCEIKDENRVFAVTAPVPIHWRAQPDIRYWTARPTEEQRKAEPWKGGEKE